MANKLLKEFQRPLAHVMIFEGCFFDIGFKEDILHGMARFEQQAINRAAHSIWNLHQDLKILHAEMTGAKYAEFRKVYLKRVHFPEEVSPSGIVNMRHDDWEVHIKTTLRRPDNAREVKDVIVNRFAQRWQAQEFIDNIVNVETQDGDE